MNVILSDIIITLGRVTLWTIASWLGGMLVGFLCYRSKTLDMMVLPLVNFIRHISPFCWLPLIILIAGIGEISVGITLLISMAFHCVIITIEMLRAIPKEIIEQARLDGTSGWTMLRYIELPVSKTGIIDIFRVLWGVGWSAVIAAEMLGVSSGMGYRLLDFRYLLRYREMLLYIIIIGSIGVGTDHFLRYLKRILPGQILVTNR
ncbi:MAG: ABC transporter permease subunit [Candidatus Cloacimonetes bacterium]|nr:ABC transporter permease subunit [Candidatus Cloacimonadota bacterium]